MKIATFLCLAAASAASAKLVTSKVPYMDGETELHGFLAYDDSWTSPKPAVIIASDWDGLNELEENWAKRIVGLGYIGFANGVFTPEETEAAVEPGARGAITGKYAGDNDLWRGRMRAAVTFLQDHELVSKNHIGAVGFCFGGGGVLELARANFPGVHGVVSVHGNFGTAAPAQAGDFDSRVLVLHGASDPNILNTERRGDNSGAMPGLEAELDAVDATWEITKFADVGHGFANPSSAAYNAIATDRSWASLANFFADVFEPQPEAHAKAPTIHGMWMDYMHGDTALKGYLAYDRAAKAPEGGMPVVLIAHDWDGITDHEIEYAEKLAAEGFLAFAVGVYTPEEDDAAEPFDMGTRMRLTGQYGGDNALTRGRMQAAVEFVSGMSQADSTKIGAIGFCFGGGAVLELARHNLDNVLGVVSMHGSLGTKTPAEGDLTARVLVLHGSQDANILNVAMRGDNSGAMPGLEEELSNANAVWEVTKYGRVVHSFTEPAAGDNPASGNAYDPLAARRAYSSAVNFLGSAFGREPRYPNPLVEEDIMPACNNDNECHVGEACDDCAQGVRRRLLFGGNGRNCMCHRTEKTEWV